MTIPPDLAAILASYPIDPVSVTLHPGGLINRSWRVETASGAFLLQRLNPEIFPDGAAVLRNVVAVTTHVTRAVARMKLTDQERRGLRLLPARNGAPGVRSAEGAWWRVLYFIRDTRVAERVTTPAEAAEAGKAYGLFLRMLADYDGDSLSVTIPGFRDTAHRVAQLESAITADPLHRALSLAADLAAIDDRRGYATLLPPLIASGVLPRRVVHNDAKSANVLRDVRTGEGLAVIDLDTVMPGTVLSDVGDLIRSMASATEEDESDLDRIVVQPALVRALARGYLAGSAGVLTATERRLFIAAGLVTTYEQAVRFYTDYLRGDRYYRITRPNQNLDRARAQLRLLQRLEEQRGALERMVGRL